jgi:hypothetical protein
MSALPEVAPDISHEDAKHERQRLWLCVSDVFTQHYHEPDLEAAKVILACVVAHRLTEYPPAWNMAIAVPGSMKTAILEPLDELPDVHLIDEVTPQTFISGKIDPKGRERKMPAGLLHRIGDQGIVIAADFSTVLTSDPRNRAKVFSQLRRIYDGHFRREFGSDENLGERDWKGRLTFLAGVTPEVDRHHKVFSALGDRFLRTRWPRAGGSAAALRAMKQDRSVATQLKTALHALMAPILTRKELRAPSFPHRLLERVASLGEFVALARAYVPRDRSDEIVGEAHAESNTRLSQELAQVGRGWAALMSENEVTEKHFALIRRVAFDSIPPLRRDILQCLMRGGKPHSLPLPLSTVARGLRDLEHVGLVSAKRTQAASFDDAEPNAYFLSPLALSLLCAAGEEISKCATSGKVT